MSDPVPPPRLGLTTWRQAVVSAVAGAIVGAAILQLFDLFKVFPPIVPWSVPAVVAVLALASVVWSRILPGRLDRREISSQEGLVTVVVAKSALMTGAVLAGMHAVYVARWVTQLAAEHPAARVWTGTATVVASLLLAWAASALERACVVDGDDDDPQQGAPRGDAEPTG